MSNNSKHSPLFSQHYRRLAQKCALIALLATWSLGAAGFGFLPEEGGGRPDEETPSKWEEVALKLPAAPKEEDLLPFYVGPTARLKFFIDAKSLSTGSDGVVRYTLVSKSESGAVNISYEGIRCETAQKRQYAFGQNNGSWTLSRQEKWVPITENVANRQDAALLKDYLCEGGLIAGKAPDIVKRIKYQQSLSSQRYDD